MKSINSRKQGGVRACLGLAALICGNVQAAVDEQEVLSPWKIDTYYENATFSRKDVGLTKFRNTIQVEGDRKLGTAGTFQKAEVHFKLRGTYDGVYRLNKDQFGRDAGRSIEMPTDNFAAIGAPAPIATPWGQSPVGPNFPAPGVFSFGFDSARNPNAGLVHLGERLHGAEQGLVFGVPVRPCDVDSRGCIKDYLDFDRHELESPEFNDRLDFIREAYVAGSLPLSDGRELFLKVGKQQVVWGRTDLFRVLDVINPVDYSRNNIYDELQDIRIPMWIAQAEYRMGATPTFDDLNFSLVWNFDKFRPNNLGQGGSPNSILDAGSFFRAMKNCWDNGCSVGNFALHGPGGGVATDFGPGQIGIRQAHLPDWSFKNTQLGAKLEGVYQGVGFSVNALTYRSQLPSLRGGIVTHDPFTAPTAANPNGVPGIYGFVPAFDIHFPRVNLVGASMDIQADAIKSVFRLEAALTHGEEFANTARPELYSKSKVLRYVIGWDRPTFIPFLNKDRTFLISAQLFGQHLLDHELRAGPLGPVGMPDWENNNIMTLLVKGFYMNDRLSPQIILARDFQAETTVAAPSIEWLVTDNLKLGLGANIKMGAGAHKFDDDSTAIPFPGLAALAGLPPSAAPLMSSGLTGFEPLGRFRAGPIGMARSENEIQFTLRYKF